MTLAKTGGSLHSRRGPTVPPPGPEGLGRTLERNIRALAARRQAQLAAASAQERLVNHITRFAGSMAFVYLHLALVGAWVLVNLGWVPGVAPFDPSFVVLAMVASVEAIFLSTFVLITQNRMSADAAQKAELDLQISLLTEHEVTKLLSLVAGIATYLGVKTDIDQEVPELEQDVAPEAVLDKLEGLGPN